MKKSILIVVVCVAFGLQAFAQDAAKVSDNLTAGAADARRQSFDIVWRTVKERHFDPTLGGVDWDAARRKYEPRVAKIKTDGELHNLLNEMLGELHQSHFGVIPPEAILEDGSFNGPAGNIRIDLRIVDGQVVIARVAPDSTASRAGLRSGFVIKQIDGAETAKMLKEEEARMNKHPLRRHLSPGLKSFIVARAIFRRAGGQPGSTARLQYLDERGRVCEATIEREKAAGELSPRIGTLPVSRMEFEAKRLAGGFGYIRFNAFMMPAMGKIRVALREFHDAPGIIFDLRGNLGGLGALAAGIVGLMETRQTSLGVTRMRSENLNLIVYPQARPYTGPMAVLIDGGSGSTTELFAAGLQELRRAVIVGERSAGAALPSNFMKLPTGALFQFAFAELRTPGGTLLEGHGVRPDVEVKHTRASLLAGRDAQLEAAIEELRKKRPREQ
ncbi:MAG TPA: S41 family peptidase [Blastocatellia bacterium]|jgi:carboxyl-terminal processing protease|nr:S41 family peptidase [Blastocatellia bacterium]